MEHTKKKESSTEELKLSIIEYKGIPYYVDLSTGNVYASEEIMRKDKELVVVGKYDGLKVEIKK